MPTLEQLYERTNSGEVCKQIAEALSHITMESPEPAIEREEALNAQLVWTHDAVGYYTEAERDEGFFTGTCLRVASMGTKIVALDCGDPYVCEDPRKVCPVSPVCPVCPHNSMQEQECWYSVPACARAPSGFTLSRAETRSALLTSVSQLGLACQARTATDLDCTVQSAEETLITRQW